MVNSIFLKIKILKLKVIKMIQRLSSNKLTLILKKVVRERMLLVVVLVIFIRRIWIGYKIKWKFQKKKKRSKI